MGFQNTFALTNGTQFANTLFTEFALEWKFYHNTSAPRNPRSNGQAEAAVKINKRLLDHAECSAQDQYMALLAYWNTPINVHLCSAADFYTSGNYTPQYHSIYETQTHVPQLIVTFLMDAPSRVLHIRIAKAAERSTTLLDRLLLSSVMPGSCDSLPLSSIIPAMAHT